MTLEEFFEKHKKIAIALSGGVDSILLMHIAKRCGADVHAYFVKTEFQPRFELCDACRAAELCGVSFRVIEVNVLRDCNISKNDESRCYFCKKLIISEIKKAADADGYSVVCDGTNASDDVSDRPGFRALTEFGILSPLKLCGITKSEVRSLAQREGLFVWNKPSYACLATRVKSGEEITPEKLCLVEKAEAFLATLGFSDFRVRISGDDAKLQLCKSDFKNLFDNREKVMSELRKSFSNVTVDLEARDE